MADRILLAYLVALGEVARLKRSAVFSLAGLRPSLETGTSVDQGVLDAVHLAWSTRQQELTRGTGQPIGAAMLVPLRDKEGLVGLLYMDPAGRRDPQRSKVLELITTQLREITTLPRALSEIGTPDTDPDELVKAALKRTAGNVAAAARLLQISRQTMYERMAGLGLDPGGFRVR